MRIVLHVAGKDLDDVLIFNRLRADLKKLCASHQVIVVPNGDAQFQAELRRRSLPVFLDTQSAEYHSLYEDTLVQLNKKLVAKLSDELIPAISMSGKHLGLIQAGSSSEGKGHFPFAKIVGVNASILEKQLESGLLPVIAPLAIDKSGASQSVDSVHVAATIASATKADLIIYLTEPNDFREKGKPVLNIHASNMDSGTEIGRIVMQAAQSIEQGTKHAFVTNLSGMENLIFEGKTSGTEILP